MTTQSKWLNYIADKFLTKQNELERSELELTIKSDLNKEAKEYPQDVSREKLETLKSGGYVKVTWKLSPSAVDSNCVDLNSRIWSLEDFLSQTSHDAPIYSKSHVGCHCTVIVEGENLDPIEISALQ